MLPAAFFALHSDLPREGPGSDEATREAIRRLPPLPPSPRVVDFGCGPGRQTLVLARTLGVPVVAVDIHAPYLDQLRRSAAEAGLADLVVTRQASMAAFDAPAGSVDLIWSEGAIFVLGFERGLRLWRPLLRPDGGLVALTEATWLTDDPAPEAAAFWRAAYPDMGTVEENTRRAEAAGYEVLDRFPLPPAAWWDDYLTPLAARAAALRPQAARDPELAAVLDETEREIEIVRRFGDQVGYVFYLMRVTGGAKRGAEANESGRSHREPHGAGGTSSADRAASADRSADLHGALAEFMEPVAGVDLTAPTGEAWEANA